MHTFLQKLNNKRINRTIMNDKTPQIQCYTMKIKLLEADEEYVKGCNKRLKTEKIWKKLGVSNVRAENIESRETEYGR